MAPSPSNDYIACFSDQGWLDVFDRNFEDHVIYLLSYIIYRLLERILIVEFPRGASLGVVMIVSYYIGEL